MAAGLPVLVTWHGGGVPFEMQIVAGVLIYRVEIMWVKGLVHSFISSVVNMPVYMCLWSFVFSIVAVRRFLLSVVLLWVAEANEIFKESWI